MRELTVNELREAYIRFFEAREHTRLVSDSLVPTGDASLLFTGAGMNQFKDEFMGRGRPGVTRAATAQKCIRTGDIESVGRTSSHHTFFEMMGNFSFGDYFKKETIEWAWQFMTGTGDGELAIDPACLGVSVYLDDDEAYDLWRALNVPADRIYRLGPKDNFWPADAPGKGPNGLCGPCSEIFYAPPGTEWPDATKVKDSEPPEASTEVWNLVFQQFERSGPIPGEGKLSRLPRNNIDTGMGLERMARVLQGAETNFDTDIFKPLLAAVCRETGGTYGKDARSDQAIRRIADHLRAVVFLIADGVAPGNMGRAYVTRRLLRRAAMDGATLRPGLKEFLYKLVKDVVSQMKVGYPELTKQEKALENAVREEEAIFRKTRKRGGELLAARLKAVQKEGGKTFPGDVAFDLWSTYGFPWEITREAAEEAGLGWDEAAFEEAARQHEAHSSSGKFAAEIFGPAWIDQLVEKLGNEPTGFTGYDTLNESAAQVRALIRIKRDGDSAAFEVTDALAGGEEGIVVLDKTPFYAESGGQLGDRGAITTGQGTGPSGTFTVQNTQKGGPFIAHFGVCEGGIRAGDSVAAQVDGDRRTPTRAHHTATHLMHHALRMVLGDHVKQAGSQVGPDALRFDFNHPNSVTAEEVARITEIVNNEIRQNHIVETRVTSLDEAKAAGAMALFGEKYGDEVRMVCCGPSKELCGGTHVAASGAVGAFRIVAESSVSAGVRRIEAVVGAQADRQDSEQAALLDALSAQLKTAPTELPERIKALQGEIRSMQKNMEALKAKSAAEASASLDDQIKDVGGVPVLAAAMEADGKELRTALDRMRTKHGSGVFVLVGKAGDRAPIACAVTKDLVERGLHAGKLLQAITKAVGGKGGGRPDMAQGGLADVGATDKAIATVGDEVEKMAAAAT